MNRIFGRNPNQAPLNNHLGRMAYQDPDSVNIAGGKVGGILIDRIVSATSKVLDDGELVRTVNGLEPDSAGAVVVEIEDIPGLSGALSNAGAVKTVNSKEPDENGDVVIGIEDISGLSGALSGLGNGLDNKVDKVAGYGLSQENYTLAEKSKLSTIEEGATANAPDAQLRDRSTHTGEQAISTITGLQTALNTIPTIPAKMPTNEAEAGTATTQRTIDAATLKAAVIEHAGAAGGTNGQGDRYIGTGANPPAGSYNNGDIYYQV